MKQAIEQQFQALQDQICLALQTIDGKGKFVQDIWQREGGGGGRSRVMCNGEVIEKGGVNFSAVFGEPPEKMLVALQLEQADFFATGVSIVLHPQSPMVPIIHMNVRYFEMSNGVWWFGGGIDLTPHYVVPEQAAWFHWQLKKVCDQHDSSYYQTFKQWADDYFYIKHRQETRGVGGIFFDHLNTQKTGKTQPQLFDFVLSVGRAFVPIYAHLVELNRHIPFGEREKKWQQLRRGRYVEFNLVWDKGTKFGLDTDGRTESILMSMPPQAHWEYNFTPPAESPEAATLTWLKRGIDWINLLPLRSAVEQT
ncbi:MAG: oxygen-dependent coproporphyrinogen oxidase [Cytophagales bacterium]|nr:oxygen-dependent coproporphyrinogen oxidase [Bernardetiaceae bacterium]MDW8206022.1 oxygen-dependent coproporphyrinogen oxidase [Cytophagales bacterium]